MSGTEPTKAPTFLYKDGEAKIFNLAPGEAFPEGWHDTPQPRAEEQPKPKRKAKAKAETEPEESESEE